MRKTYLSFFLIFLFPVIIFSQSYTISGYITDAKTSETLISASVFENNSAKGMVSNTYGFYSLTIPKGDVQLRYSYVGYEPVLISFNLSKDTTINIALEEHNVLKEVTVVANRQELGVMGSQMSAVTIPISQIKTVPTLFGETDVIKALQLLPGVQAGTEGSAGFYVRGGGPDENLFLLDGIPVYNVNHMGGFFSVFNADAIKNVTLYKGGFPARFGGRLSSVLDISMNDGNNKKLKGTVSVGLISSKLNLEGPLFNEKTTFNISARRTYFDIIAQPLLKIISNMEGNEGMEKLRAGYYFYDLNAKVSHKFSDKDRLYLSFYMGDDAIYANIKEDDAYYGSTTMKTDWDWGNLITALRWNHIINNKLFMNVTGAFTRYRFNMDIGMEDKGILDNDPHNTYSYDITMKYKSGIEDISAKVDFDYTPNPNHDIKFGASYFNHNFKPGVTSAKIQENDFGYEQKLDTAMGDNNIRAHESAFYIEDNISIGNIIKANVGLHYSNFYVQKEFYQSLQPRLSMRVLLSDKLSFKGGYAYMNQYIHLLSNNNISLPTDLWVPVTKRIEPMKSHQFSAGFFYNLLDICDLSIEGYYKSMSNLLEYKDGATFLGNNSGWEDKVSMGQGWSYGVELLAQKTIGKTTGWVGYTWSKSERLFDRPGQELNNGLKFPAKYDRRHDLSVVVSHKFNDKIDISGTWVFSTGNCGTLGLQNYYAYPVPDASPWRSTGSISHIEQRNNYRYPNYHRLDLGINFHKQKKRGVRTWNISIYNAYNQMNPFMITQWTKQTEGPAIYVPEGDYWTYEMIEYKVLKQITIFPIIPSISYTFKF
ncbi:TonB-dependent receptor [Paludibacter sp. 221]|uniref:TonB-dependent receptor n=1 Tax=Paludibacter sp. 221 TaxID=2302939 RepID=UPI0013D7E227|nr:TonB-dependent receptor [Paludibacter sp. 221]NDV45605.1 TonB-dependent receptor [Paludibacter sp. 221]